jgi:hypothetical protein
MSASYVTLPVTTQTVPLINNTVATPLVANVIVALSVFVPAMYAVVIEQVIVILPDVLLNIETISPAANVASGIVIDPLVPTPTNSPMSVVASEYELVLSDPDCGIFL